MRSLELLYWFRDIETLPAITSPDKDWAVRGKGDQPRKVIKAAPHTDEELIDWNKQLKKKYFSMEQNEQRYEMLHQQLGNKLEHRFEFRLQR